MSLTSRLRQLKISVNDRRYVYAGPAGPNSESVGTSETVPSRFRSHSTNSADYLGAQSQTGDHLVNMTRIGGPHKRPKISVTRKLGVSFYLKDIKVILLIYMLQLTWNVS